LVDIGGAAILNKFNTSPSQLLNSVYPEYDWLPWKFEKGPSHYWEDVKNQRKFMDWAAKQIGIKEMSDWYNITYQVTKHLW
jgi:hypothetical protein